MKKILFLLLAGVMLSCGNPTESSSKFGNSFEKENNSLPETSGAVTGADEYIKTISGFTCEKAAVTDNGYLIIAIDATSNEGYDNLASQFLDEAKREGVTGLKGCAIVDIKNAKFEQGAVVGKRIGRAYD